MVDQAQAVVIGGGVGGASIAYHLAELGWRDVTLVERAALTSGSTFHSAGLVGQLRGSTTLTRMMMYGVALYRRLSAETGVDVSWHEVGSLRLASTAPDSRSCSGRLAGPAPLGCCWICSAHERHTSASRSSMRTGCGALSSCPRTDSWIHPA